jgi:hypothetical protein
MKPETWEILAALLVGVAVVAAGLAMFRSGGRGSTASRWDLVAGGARLAGVITLSVALALVLAEAKGSILDPQSVLIGLTLAMLGVHLILTWYLGIGSAGPVVDVVALALIVADLILAGTGASTCFSRTVPVQAQWILFLIGGGSILVAGNAALSLVLRRGVAQRGWVDNIPGHTRLQGRTGLNGLLIQATFLALVALGSGLIVSVWWAWRTVGTWLGGDSHEGWMAIAWLVAAMSLLAWQLGSRRGKLMSGRRWAAGLAVVAEATVVLGLLILVQV